MMTKLLWRATAVLIVIGALAAVPLLLSHDSHSQSAAAKAVTARLAHAALLERERGEEAGGGADAEAYTDRAYPGDEISMDEIQGAIAANDAVTARGREAELEVGLHRPRHARRRPARHAVVHQADPVVRPRDGADRRPEVQAAGVHALRRRGRRRALADEERARAEPRLEADLRRHPDERDRLDRRRPERPDRQDDLRRHRRGKRERRQRGRARPLQDDRRRRPLGARRRARSPSPTTARSRGSRSSRATRTTS